MDKLQFCVSAECAGQRLDGWLASLLPDMSRSALQKLCTQGCVTEADKILPKNHKLRENAVITVHLPDPTPLDVQPKDIPLDIVYEDADLLVVNKPKGMVVHPAAGHYDDTLVNALLYHCGDSLSGINGVLRPGIVHRIDRDTSGLLLVAKNDMAHISLAAQIQAHTLDRFYEAVVYGTVKQPAGTVDAPIGRDPKERKRQAVCADGRNAVTHYTLLVHLRGFSHLQLQLETGRTHQIRVHMAYIGHPVAGDVVYGPKNPITTLHGQCLHARTIGFVHPRTGAHLQFTSPLPATFSSFLQSRQICSK